ncbi:MAG: putative 2-aminoethylphosphonate ABC transporter substrate-binding protein [Armatimonadota bacterium]
MLQPAMTVVFRRLVAWVVLAVLAAGLVSSASAQAPTRLTVYTALENEQLAPYKAAFEADNPGVTIDWVRDSTGVITARILAEKENPRADAIWGLAVTSLLIFDEQNMLLPYTPRGADALKPAFRDTKNPMTWTGMDAWLSVICYNHIEAKRRGLRAPSTWQDLLNPAYKGRVVMPNPASSGTGYLTIAAWLQMLGEQKGWEYMDKLHENIGLYLHSGTAPCNRAAQGEFAMAIAFDARGALLKQQGAPIEVIIPKEGAGWDMEATAIVRGTRNQAAAQRLADFTVTRRANELYNQFYSIVALPGLTNVPPFYPPNAEKAMFKNDLAWMAKNRARILQEWARRYDTKSAPR